MAWYHHLTDGFSAEMRHKAGGLDAHLPKHYSDEELGAKRPVPPESKPILDEVERLVSIKDFESASSIVEKSFQKKAQVRPGRYEFEELVSVLYRYTNPMDKPEEKRAAPVNEFGEWYRNHPENPYAASLYANALHSLGYSYRGEDWAHEVSDEGWDKFAKYSTRSVEVLHNCFNRHGDHWLYRDVDFSLSISDHPTVDELWQRFELAYEQEPLSTSLWLNFADFLLPRWFGSYKELNRLSLISIERTHDSLGMLIYARILAMMSEYGEDPEDIVMQPELLTMAAEDMVARDDDRLRTLGASMFAMSGDNQSAKDAVAKINTLYHEWWIHPNEPYLVVGVGLLQSERAAKKAA